jgi:sucrose-6-phosphate hydrolase SacC (GH32 family)
MTRIIRFSALVFLTLCSMSSVGQAFFTGSQWATAGNFTKIYDPSVGEAVPWFFNDHTFIKDASGTWHLFGITDEEPLIPPGVVEDSDQFGHATAPSLAGPWTKQPFALTTYDQGPSCTASTCYHETHLWAPHVILNNGVYYMFYSGGGANRENVEMNLATSTDLYNWTRSPGGPLFKDGYEARDPMVIRYDNQWIMYYTATEFPNQPSKHIVAYRTSSDLLHWNARQIAFTDIDDDGTDAGGTESPFVVQRGSLFYLFLGPRPYDDIYIPPDYPGTDVFVSTNPLLFGLSQHVGHIAAHACEVVADGTNLLISHAGWASQGVYTAPLAFHDTPVSGSNLYGLSANKDSIWKWSGSGMTWSQIGGPASKLVAGGFGTFAVQPSGINRYSGSGTSWTNVGGAAPSFAVNAIGLYRIDVGGEGVSKWSSGTTWTPIGGDATALYAGGRDVFRTDPTNFGHIHRYTGTTWEDIGDSGTTWAVNANGIYGLNNYGVFQWSGFRRYWVWIDGPAGALFAGGNSVYDTTPFFGNLYMYTNSTDNWTPVSSPAATSFAVCDDALYALRSNGVYKQTGSSWTQIRNVAMSSIVCGK